jgi:nicotinamidase-related amidase
VRLLAAELDHEEQTMGERVWDRFLSESDRRRASRQPAARKGGGQRPALVLIDLYRAVFGDEPATVEEALDRWPNSCGMAAWNALPSLMELLASAREHGIPVFHVTGDTQTPNWRDPRAATLLLTEEGRARYARRFDIVDEVAPVDGEVVLRKNAPSGFFGTLLAPLLIREGADTIIVAGESTSGCVRATVVDGKSYRFKVLVPEECVFDRDEAPHAINLFDMDQKYADVLPLADVIAYLDETVPVAALAGVP